MNGSVLQIAVTYEIHGLVEDIASYSVATLSPPSTEIVNQVQNVYNSFQQLIAQYQEHGGP